jgi:hypothetical protein
VDSRVLVSSRAGAAATRRFPVFEPFAVRQGDTVHRNAGRRALAAVVMLILLILGVSSVSAAATPFQARGIWLCCGPIVAGTNFVITGGTNARFTGYDEGTNGNVLGTITGGVTGTTMTIVFTYKVSPYAGEITTYVARVSAGGNSLAGTSTYAIPPNPSNGVEQKFSAVRGTNVTCGTHGGNLGCEALLSTTICTKDFGATACKRARAHIT